MLEYLKTAMASERLGGLATVSVGKEIPSDTYDKDLIEELAGRKSRKVGSALAPRQRWLFANSSR